MSAPTRTCTDARCFSYGDPGHRRANCPKLTTGRAFLIEDTCYILYDSPPIYDEYVSEGLLEEHVTGNTGPTLVLRRACLAPLIDTTDPQRSVFFQSTCTVNGKVCKFIIDSSACENVVATATVEKLFVPSEIHLKPYSLAWLLRGHSVTVD